MRLPRMTTPRLMVTVVVVAIGLAVLSHWRSSPTSRVRICVRLFEIDPPAGPFPAGFDPDEPDSPLPDTPRSEP